MAKVRNPWSDLFQLDGSKDADWHKREAFYSQSDAEALDAFHADLPEGSTARADLSVPPEPFAGNIYSATVIMLASHPTVLANGEALANETWQKAYRKNLNSGGLKGGFYYAKSLDTLELPGAQPLLGVRRVEEEESESGKTQRAQGGMLSPLLNDLAQRMGEEGFNHASDQVREEIAAKLYKNFMLINLFPYAVDYSREAFAHQDGQWLPSQRYQQALVKLGLKRAKQEKHPPLVIVSRRQQEWYEMVPKLQHKFGKKPKSLTLMQHPGLVLSQSALDSVNGRGAYKQVLKRLRA
ncbi:hypothetical protein [Corynebacterium pseudopelargi]|uniref:Uncharacterized protein n=1 Tax=Corynebacterium pseudopelargi TaxID=2080757 RepID=A0A3G6IWY7_9CORY|nr:hypothetical protein [Corynebacterium pseudopelargi]AZA08620.1 hypothetical protein CPPEL_02420 [Corynebacterium pseudopelargi]